MNDVVTTLANLVRAEAERGSRLLRVALMLCENPPVAEPPIDTDGAGINEEDYARTRARCDAQAAELNALREALGVLPGDRRESLVSEVLALRAKVAELTPGPWIDPAVEPPPLGELIQTLGLGGALSLCSLRPGSTPDDNRWLHRWRRVSAAILAKPEGTT